MVSEKYVPKEHIIIFFCIYMIVLCLKTTVVVELEEQQKRDKEAAAAATPDYAAGLIAPGLTVRISVTRWQHLPVLKQGIFWCFGCQKN